METCQCKVLFKVCLRPIHFLVLVFNRWEKMCYSCATNLRHNHLKRKPYLFLIKNPSPEGQKSLKVVSQCLPDKDPKGAA